MVKGKEEVMGTQSCGGRIMLLTQEDQAQVSGKEGVFLETEPTSEVPGPQGQEPPAAKSVFTLPKDYPSKDATWLGAILPQKRLEIGTTRGAAIVLE